MLSNATIISMGPLVYVPAFESYIKGSYKSQLMTVKFFLFFVCKRATVKIVHLKKKNSAQVCSIDGDSCQKKRIFLFYIFTLKCPKYLINFFKFLKYVSITYHIINNISRWLLSFLFTILITIQIELYFFLQNSEITIAYFMMK